MKQSLISLFVGLLAGSGLSLPAPTGSTPLLMATGSQPLAEAGPVVQVVRLRGTYAEHPDPNAFDPLSLLAGVPQRQKSFFKLCEFIDDLAEDDDVEHVMFDLSAPTIGMNLVQIAELQRRMEGLRDAGKRTWAWLENGGTKHYAIAVLCDEVVMVDFGMLDLPSLAMSSLHFKSAMDMIGVEASATRVGDYKGATEPYTEAHMSDHLRAHYRDMLASMNGALVARIAAARSLPVEAIRERQSQRLFLSNEALDAGLVDALAPAGEGRRKIAVLIGESVDWREMPTKQRKAPSFFELFGEMMGGAKRNKMREPGVAILHLEGMIIDGIDKQPGTMVSGPTVAAIRELARNSMVKGVVVRINSPGGSATASEAIRSALEDLSRAKPVTYSMGSVAASGGYWITCIGAPIFAQAQTITGSIGVLALKLDFGGLLGRMGLNFEDVQLDESAGMMSLDRGWTGSELERIQAFCDQTYARFLKIASASRGMKEEEVDAVGGGRVWSGTQAAELGLVDAVGGIERALADVAERAELAPGYSVGHYPTPPSPFELLGLMGSQEEIRSLPGLDALGALERAGFRLEIVKGLLRQALDAHVSGPQLWLVGAEEIVLR